jgi:mRNA interferase MazF
MPRLTNVVVALITTRIRGVISEVALGPEDGLPRACVVSLDNLTTVPKAQLVESITLISPSKMTELCVALALATDCGR